MGRLKVFEKRQPRSDIGQFIGKLIIFCEGYTEYNYFRFFAEIINNKLDNKYSTMEIVPVNAEGNAQHVLDFANDFLNNDDEALYINHTKCLVFDCDAPPNIQEVIAKMRKSNNNFILCLTNLLFETWLLMHFIVIDKPLSKKMIYVQLAEQLGIDEYGDNEKNDLGLVRRIIDNGDNVCFAISNAIQLQQQRHDQGIIDDYLVIEINPYTTVHVIMRDILHEIERFSSK